ncbi:unnamed protein product [Ceratitis capitata]|uniref:(Mediterranean fruit fly) hypothetical protein n=1 Tax=Ceratitis capitata TaxID=7213 RepID=A0A811V329_CERCA|nr:unnamed protein product [Ceratitis capitata]
MNDDCGVTSMIAQTAPLVVVKKRKEVECYIEREGEKQRRRAASSQLPSVGLPVALAIWQAASQATDLATNHTEPSLTAMSATHPAALLNAKCWSVLAMCLLLLY